MEKKEDKQIINRIVLIGNGFDLMNGLKTSYGHFIKDYLCKRINKFITDRRLDNDDLIQFDCEEDDHMSFYDLEKEYTTETAMSFFDDINKKNFRSIKLSFPSKLLENIYNKVKMGWVDIEGEYYRLLVEYYNFDNRLEKVQKLNSDLKKLKNLLKSYLQNEQKKYPQNELNNSANSDGAYSPLEKNDFPKLTQESFNNCELGDVLYLNFNYTQPDFKDRISNQKPYSMNVINIHGTLDCSDKMIFGYGDELDDHYKTIEKNGNNEWLKGFKSFDYLQSIDYNHLLGFIEKGEYQVYIAGHSCGLSDKTLLNQLFEHKHCQSIKIFYHKFTEGERKDEDTFNDTIYNISRIMDNKVKLRNIVGKKSYSHPINHLSDLAPTK